MLVVQEAVAVVCASGSEAEVQYRQTHTQNVTDNGSLHDMNGLTIN